ncbi:MAG: hypothetical protein OEW23_19600 [Candidatus Aminicenantes bacterium]|nr:hypothetical protein [Candidatus Aminicenantes bacterium]
MNKLYISIIVSILFFGCAAYVTPEGTYLEPLPVTFIIGPPVVVEAPPPPGIFVRPLPPVVLYPDRHIYFHGGLYYYYWDGGWFYSDRDRGPWHRLHKKYYPPRFRRH